MMAKSTKEGYGFYCGTTKTSYGFVAFFKVPFSDRKYAEEYIKDVLDGKDSFKTK